ncbi:MAG TPA: zinc-binding dehydrogenase [Acidimicrobiales bacterium]|nr:zinc-binding dehydrogenase [Acidimicrobiales bacterium]
MRAAVIVEGAVTCAERPDPVPGTGELLVRVRAAGLNGADLLQRAGRYPPPPGTPPDQPGMEFAGEVEAVGAGATRFSAGDRVMGIVAGAAQAELVVVHERVAMPVPDVLSWPEAGGVPEVFTTAHDALFTQCGLRPGERLLVNGAAGGVGIAAVQLAVVSGSSVVASVRSPERREALASFGATPAAPDDAFGLGPFDVVLELVGGPNLPADLDALAIGGRISVIGIGAGGRAEVGLGLLMARRARVHGSTLRARPLEEKALAARLVERHVLPQLAAERVRVPVEATFPLADVGAAYERFAAGNKLGKIVLVTDGT